MPTVEEDELKTKAPKKDGFWNFTKDTASKLWGTVKKNKLASFCTGILLYTPAFPFALGIIGATIAAQSYKTYEERNPQPKKPYGLWNALKEARNKSLKVIKDNPWKSVFTLILLGSGVAPLAVAAGVIMAGVFARQLYLARQDQKEVQESEAVSARIKDTQATIRSNERERSHDLYQDFKKGSDLTTPLVTPKKRLVKPKEGKKSDPSR